MNFKTYISFLFFTVLFVSCERDIEFKGEITNPLVVVNSFITPDSVVSANISLSRFFLKDSTEFRSVNNAEVSLWVNGLLKEKLALSKNGNYKGSYKPLTTDQIKLTVDVPQMPQVSATVLFPEKPLVLNIDTQRVVTKSQNHMGGYPYGIVGIRRNYTTNYKLLINDKVNEQNYYRFILDCVAYTGSWNYNTHKIDTVPCQTRFDFNVNFTDVVFGNIKDPLADSGTSPVGSLLTNSINVYNIFSDDIFNGKIYTLKFSTNEIIDQYFNIESLKYHTENILSLRIYISLQGISKDYYLYLKTRAASSASNFFSEPVKVHSNINGGIGILGSYTSSNVVELEIN